MDERICPDCGARYSKKPGPGRWPKRCAECRRVHPAGPRVPELVVKVCQWCGADYETPRDRRHSKYCSASCRARACDERRSPDRRAEQRARQHKRTSAMRAAKWRGIVVVCGSCGAAFCPLKRRSCVPKYCSKLCANRAYSRRRYSTPEGKAYKADQNRARRARKRATWVEPVKGRVVFERDGWTCGICDGDIDPTLSPRDHMGATVDHIVALANGGSHTYGNVQAAHMICNARKRHAVA